MQAELPGIALEGLPHVRYRLVRVRAVVEFVVGCGIRTRAVDDGVNDGLEVQEDS